jgi:acylphosphatase
MTQVSYRAYASGRVQGVFYRASAQRKAHELGVNGWVRNCPDGRVEAQLEGEQTAVDQMLAWMREGPSAAQVEDVQVESVSPENAAGFNVV